MDKRLDVRRLGQVFTPASVVDSMLALRRNRGRTLEPACGDGRFLAGLEDGATGIELDGSVAPPDRRVMVGDFFAYPLAERFDTIIGNPPFVRHLDIADGTRALLDMGLFDGRSNLYLFFIAKCMRHLRHGGELIFITPRDFLKATSARKLNGILYEQGSMTHYYELGDRAIFQGASPNCAIWRWQKGRRARSMATGGDFCHSNGQLWFGEAHADCLGDYFDVRVGAVSGADHIFVNAERGDTRMVCSTTARDGRARNVIYNREDDSLLPHKEFLLERRIRKFDESNWWQWGRRYCHREGPRIYVNSKTRNPRPFFVSDMAAYDGSVMALFPKGDMDLPAAADRLNGTDWGRLGFVCDGRFLFTQKSLATAPVAL